MADIFKMYVSLWRKAEDFGVAVAYDGCMPDGQGKFHPDPSENRRGFPLDLDRAPVLRRAVTNHFLIYLPSR